MTSVMPFPAFKCVWRLNILMGEGFKSCHPDCIILWGLELSGQDVLTEVGAFGVLNDWPEEHLSTFRYIFVAPLRRLHGDTTATEKAD